MTAAGTGAAALFRMGTGSCRRTSNADVPFFLLFYDICHSCCHDKQDHCQSNQIRHTFSPSICLHTICQIRYQYLTVFQCSMLCRYRLLFLLEDTAVITVSWIVPYIAPFLVCLTQPSYRTEPADFCRPCGSDTGSPLR